MKKLLLLLGVLIGSLTVNASYLYWQVDTSQSIPGDASYAHLVYYSSGAYGSGPVQYASAWYNFETVEAPYISYDLATLTDYNSATGAYFVEFLNYDSVSNPNTATVAGQSSEGKSYSQLSSMLVSGAMTEVAQASVWTGGGTYAVPEPTSGMMMMVALALLGLRRKQVA